VESSLNPVDAGLLSRLDSAEERDLALEELATSASRSTVEVAVPSLVSLASNDPPRVEQIARVLRRLDHDAACQLLVNAAIYVCSEEPSAAGAAALAELGRKSFPPMLTVLRDLMRDSRDPDIRRVGEAVAATYHPPRLIDRCPANPANRWLDIARYGRTAASREELVRLFEAMADTWTYLAGHERECPEWRHRELEDYFNHLPAREFLALPHIPLAGKTLGGVLEDMANWLSVEPCLPNDPAFWARAASAYYAATLASTKPDDRLVVTLFLVGTTVCEFYLSPAHRPYLKTPDAVTSFVKLSDPRTWLDGRSPRPWTAEFDGKRIEILRQRQRQRQRRGPRQGLFAALRPIGHRIYVDQRLVAYRRF
jgi:hypothetical protein